MILILIEGPNTLAVNDDHIDLFTIRGGSLNGRTPAPEPLGTGVDGGAYPKAATLVQEHSVQ